MKVAGTGSEGLIMLIPLAFLVLFLMVGLGGPGEFFAFLDDLMRDLLRSVSLWADRIFA